MKLAVTFGLLILAAGSPPVFAQGNGAAALPSGRQVQVTEKILPLRIPGETLGETEGVSQNSQGHMFVNSRTGWAVVPRRQRGAAVRIRRESQVRQKVDTERVCRVFRPRGSRR